ncbi:hypothetical protein [Arcicella sp. LKC2W]
MGTAFLFYNLQNKKVSLKTKETLNTYSLKIYKLILLKLSYQFFQIFIV